MSFVLFSVNFPDKPESFRSAPEKTTKIAHFFAKFPEFPKNHNIFNFHNYIKVMNEIEVKILEIDKIKVIEKLESLGAKKCFEGRVNASFFDFSDKKLEKNNSFLRLRDKENFSELTLKKSISKDTAKIMDETEIVVDNFKNAKKILESLGLVESKKKANKKRISYSLNDVHFEIDSLENYPTYLEIEAPDLEKLKIAVEKMGFSMKDTKPWSMKEVREYYKNKK